MRKEASVIIYIGNATAKVHALVVLDEFIRYGISVGRDFLLQGHVVMVKRGG